MEAFRKVGELQVRALVLRRGESRHQCAQAGTVDIGYFPKVENQAGFASAQEILEFGAEQAALLTQGYTARQTPPP